MFRGEVTATDKDTLKQEIVVTIGIFKDEELVEERKLGFPWDIDKKELKSELKKYMDTYIDDIERAVEQVKFDKKDESATRTLESVSGMTI